MGVVSAAFFTFCFFVGEFGKVGEVGFGGVVGGEVGGY